MILLAIKSCWRNRARRDACRATWLPALDRSLYDYTFIVGNHAALRRGSSRTESLYGEDDVASFDIADDFKNIAPKIRHAAQLAISASQLVVVDDDTYLRPERLPREMDADVIAFMRQYPDYPQGAITIYGPHAIKRLAESETMLRSGPDDVLAGEALDGLAFQHTAYFNPGPEWRTAYPRKDNDVIATHKCLPAEMLLAHAAWQDS